MNVQLAPGDVRLIMPDPRVPLCESCVDAYRNGIEPGETACEGRGVNLWSVEAKAKSHNGSRRFFVIAPTQPDASRIACAEAPQAGVVTLKLCEVDGERRALLMAEAVNASDWVHIEGDRVQDQYERFREEADLARPANEVKEEKEMDSRG